ncbi:MAG: EthD domain-containing protein [Henriciella sp.]|nr:EthD domain-containing protein [Henriciella sp.]
MIKLTFCLHRLPHLSRAAFQNYWREHHAPLVASYADVLNIRRYVQTHALTHDANASVQNPRGAPEGYDGIAELWWDSWESLDAASRNPGGLEAGAALLKDEATFIDLKRSPLWFNEEHQIVG